MTKPIGGRGYKAPYSTTHVRVPTDIKPQVEALIDNYRNQILEVDANNSLTTSENNMLTSLDEVLVLAQEILARKQSARKSMGLLLTTIYGKDVNL
jgi:acyl transferase domain-containing protein